MNSCPPFFFNFLRFFVAFLFLSILLIISRNFTKEGKKPINLKTHLKGGFYSGTTIAFGAAIIMSLESVFAVLLAAVLLSETMSTIQLAGCSCIYAAVIIAQVERKK